MILASALGDPGFTPMDAGLAAGLIVIWFGPIALGITMAVVMYRREQKRSESEKPDDPPSR